METDVRLAKELKKVLVEFGDKHGVAPLGMVTLLGSMILDLGLSLEAAVQDDLHSAGDKGSAPFLEALSSPGPAHRKTDRTTPLSIKDLRRFARRAEARRP